MTQSRRGFVALFGTIKTNVCAMVSGILRSFLVGELWSYEFSKPSIDLYMILTNELRGLTL